MHADQLEKRFGRREEAREKEEETKDIGAYASYQRMRRHWTSLHGARSGLHESTMPRSNVYSL